MTEQPGSTTCVKPAPQPATSSPAEFDVRRIAIGLALWVAAVIFSGGSVGTFSQKSVEDIMFAQTPFGVAMVALLFAGMYFLGTSKRRPTR